jgi:glycosyltransferase involved in cell wall biosynthesis
MMKYGGNTAYEWHVTTGNLKNRSLEPAFHSAGAKVHYVSPGFANPWRALGFLCFLRQHRFDALMTFNGVFGGLPLALGRICGVPARIGHHRRSTPAFRQTLGRRLYARSSLALLSWASTRIVSNSQTALNYFYGEAWRGSNHYAVIPNGVDAHRFQPRPEIRSEKRFELGLAPEHLVIGHVGRVDPAKDHETLFAISRTMRAVSSRMRLLIIGTGTDSEAVKDRLVHYGIADITVALGVRDDVHSLYSTMDVFVFPSVTEGQPNALIEAMLCGLPVVASDIPSIREAIPASMVSNLFPTRNVKEACNLVSEALFAPAKTCTLLPWAQERYDLESNLDEALRELTLE